tara:strand:- start:6794 stop:7618 length:825 start_codon:yes stop_codon:yes gene_type:complete
MSIQITPRRIHFQFNNNIPKHWYNQSAVHTYHVNIFGLFIPDGEEFFIRSAKPFLQHITDEKLYGEVRAFLKQEANHRREHMKYAVHTIYKHYPNLKQKNYKFPIIQSLAWLGGAKFRLAMTAAGEHFTAILADYYLQNPHYFEGVPEPIKEMWHWHFVEEIEHKAVVFDMLKALKIGYLRRSTSFILMSLYFFSGYIRPFCHMARTDNNLFSLKFLKTAFQFYWTNPGVLRKLLAPYFSYLKPNFHPWQHNNADLIESWSAKLNELERKKSAA